VRRAPAHLDACFLPPELKQELRPADIVAEAPR
jgi:hypothetical protein